MIFLIIIENKSKMKTINISDLDIEILFEELWNNTITASYYKYNSDVTVPSYTKPENYYRYFDYHCGRPIKTDFTDVTKISYKAYDRDAGNGKFIEIVEKLRNK